MLSKTENRVMGVLYERCREKNALLISPDDLIKCVGDKELTLTKLDKIVVDLGADGYFELVYSERSGERVYCLALTEKGKGYLRKKKLFRRNLIFRVALTSGLALLSFVIGLVLKAIF